MNNKSAIALVIAALTLAGLACNVANPTGQNDPQGTLQAAYATVTARAASGTQPPVEVTTGGIEEPEETAAAEATGTLEPTPTQVQTPTTSPTPPDARVDRGAPFEIPRCGLPVLVDGAPGDWDDQPNVAMVSIVHVTYGEEEWTNADDSAASARLCWTDTALYLYIDVTDDALVQTQSGIDIYRGDEVEITFDGDLYGDFYEDDFNDDDRHFGVTGGNFNDVGADSVRYQPTQATSTTIQVGGQRPIGTGGSYALEIGVPWSELGVTPAVDAAYGLCLAVSDNDQAGEASQDSLTSNCSDLSVFDPTTWITVRMAE